MVEHLLPVNLGVVEHLPTSSRYFAHLKDYIDTCIVEGKSPKTIEIYQYNIETYLKSIHPASPDAGNARGYLSGLYKNHSVSTVHQVFRTLRTWFNWLVKWELIKDNPLLAIRAPRLPKRIRRNYTNEQIGRVLTYCEQPGFTHIRNRAIILVYLDTALRVSELTNLKKSDIDIGSGSVRVIGKGDKERLVRLSIPTRQALLVYLRKRADDFDSLWVSEERRPMTVDGMKGTIHKLCVAAGLKGQKLSSHTFRHTAARHYLMNGGDLRTLQYMMGHSDIKTTQVYLTDIADVDMFKVHERVSPVANLLKPHK